MHLLRLRYGKPHVPGAVGLRGGVWYRVSESYYDARAEGGREPTESTPTPWSGWRGRPIWKVVADPSAASFIETLRRRGWRVEKADNDVLAGIEPPPHCCGGEAGDLPGLRRRLRVYPLLLG